MTESFDPELLDAYLDDELDAAGRSAVEEALATSPELSDELAAVAAIRDGVRALPAVDPPFGYFERMLLGARRREKAPRAFPGIAASVAAIAAAWFLVLGIGSGLGVLDTVPAVGDFADRHAAALEAMPEPAAIGGYEAMPMDKAMAMGPEIEGTPMTMMGAYRDGAVMHLMYADGAEVISVFRQETEADLGGLADGERMEMAGGPAWHGVVDNMDVLVTVRGTATYTVVGEPAAMPAMGDIVAHLPMADRSLLDRARGAARELVETFGLD